MVLSKKCINLLVLPDSLTLQNKSHHGHILGKLPFTSTMCITLWIHDHQNQAGREVERRRRCKTHFRTYGDQIFSVVEAHYLRVSATNTFG